jgi:hypothetical protein
MSKSEGWSKGYTKETHSSVKKISDAMKNRGVDNFKEWREEAKQSGRIPSSYPELVKGGDLAELIGVILGDGHIQKFPRTERLLIFSNASNTGFVERYTTLVEQVFDKKPTVYKVKGQECVRIGIYQKHISERLGIPAGARKNLDLPVPDWILSNNDYVVRYLRGLYEAEGSESHHAATSTHKFSFANMNQSILENVYGLMAYLGFHPSMDSKRVQLSRKSEVQSAIELLEFRKY